MADHHLDSSASLNRILLKLLLIFLKDRLVDDKLLLFIGYLHPEVINNRQSIHSLHEYIDEMTKTLLAHLRTIQQTVLEHQ